MVPPDIVSVQKNFNGATVATIQKPNRSGGGSNDYIKTVDFQRFVFTTPSIMHEIIHNKNTTQFMETIYSEDGDKMYAPIEVVDRNTIRIYFTEALPCRVDVLFGKEYTP